MEKAPSFVKKSIILSIIVGMVVGMGNGSVFGIYLMANLGRGKFSNWGGFDSYTPTSFNGFMTWCMLVFGVAFVGIMLLALHGHDKMAQKRVGGHMGGHGH